MSIQSDRLVIEQEQHEESNQSFPKQKQETPRENGIIDQADKPET